VCFSGGGTASSREANEAIRNDYANFGEERCSYEAHQLELQRVRYSIRCLPHFDRVNGVGNEYAEPGVAFAKQTFRVYLTAKGLRVVCTSALLPWEKHDWLATRLMKYLGADPDYIRLCGEQKCYRARLTPKPWRTRDCSGYACHLGAVCGNLRRTDPVEASLVAQLMLHDELSCIPEEGYETGEERLA
jgi:hypothetical protein